MDFIASLYSALSSDAALVSLIAEYEGEPAIFSGDMLPPGLEAGELPYIWIRPPHTHANFDTLDSSKQVVEIDVCLYAAASQSSAAIDAAATRARIVLHRQILSDGANEALCAVTGPLGAPTSRPEIAGRRLSARLS